MLRCRNPQLALGLKAAPRWGGARARAGRKPGSRPRVRHGARAGTRPYFPCHVTLKVRSDVPSLRSARLVREIEVSLTELRAARDDFRLVHYSLQKDHAHCLVEANDRRALARGMKALGARLARAVNRVFRRRGAVLADRYHLHVLKTPREVRNALAYVLLNARRHAGRALAGSRIDPASSGRWFDGWRRDPDPGRAASVPREPPVARPRSWLLRIGWRRHGRIDPAEVPGRQGQGSGSPQPRTGSVPGRVLALLARSRLGAASASRRRLGRPPHPRVGDRIAVFGRTKN